MLATACGDSDEEGSSTTPEPQMSEHVAITGVPGVTDTEIRFSMVSTSTAKNPTGECGLECFSDGVRAYFEYRNSQGGIYGRKLVLDTPIDDELGKGQEAAIRVIASNETLATFLYVLVSTSYTPFVDANWPVYGYLTDHTAMSGKMNLFSTYSVSSFDVPRPHSAFAAKVIGATKVAAVGYSVGSSATCVDQKVREFDGEYKELGVEMVYSNKNLPFGLPNGVGPEVTAMKKAGVELVYTCMVASSLLTFAQEMKRQGLDAPLITYSGFEPDFVEQNADVLEGAIEGLRVRPSIATPSKGQALFNEWTKKTDADVKFSTYHGWASADEMFQGLTKAGAPFTRQKLIDATNSLTQWTADGVVAPIDVGRQHNGQTPDDPVTHGDRPDCFSYVQVKKGKLTLMPPATKDKPYVCWPGGTFKYSEPTARSFGDK
jgi:ABC-type branched-subunit amino acid transport system substrate-binding protein